MDANGNTGSITSSGEVLGLAYDDRDRLALAQRNLKAVMRYVVNGRGERVRKELATKQAPTQNGRRIDVVA
jgi:hypothetical protein